LTRTPTPTVPPTATPNPNLRAFPGAEGYGANALGGRGGVVYEVTNLNDSGAGSLRACVEASGPRTCVFKVAGTITLLTRLRVLNPYLTIAGQTAPGEGITLRNGSNNPNATLLINTDHVIVRYIRMRAGKASTANSSLDSLAIIGAENVIVDHVSTSWSTDGTLDIAYSSNVTVQWSIISEALYNGNHVNGPHSMGMLLNTADHVTIHHNLFVSNRERNPRVASTTFADIVNNVMYNFGSTTTFISSDNAPASANFVGNYLKSGPNTGTGLYGVHFTGNSTNPKNAYVSGNFYLAHDYANGADINIVHPDTRQYVVSTRFGPVMVNTTTASVAYSQVLANAGAILPDRDAVDDRILSNVNLGTGAIIDDPSQVGGWPTLATGTPYVDSDRDGMSNTWETLNGFNPNDANDRNGDPDGDGYTNLEEFLNNSPPR
jgi:pectate lyase